MPASGRIRILVAEDHFVTRAGLRAIFGTQPDLEVMAEAETGPETVALARKHRPDVTILDLGLPGMEGTEIIHAILSDDAQARILVLTGSEGNETIYRALHAGARAYLLKDTKGPELLQAVRDVYAGKRVVPSEVAALLAERIPQSDLSAREVEVLRLIVDGRSNKQIAAELALSEGTVRTHVSHILGKLQVDDRTQAATAALKRGIL